MTSLSSPSILFLNTFYTGFLQHFYDSNPQLIHASYNSQFNALIDTCFGDSNFYSQGLAKLGWRTMDLIINCDPLQRKWAEENNFQGNAWEIVFEQVRRFEPDIIYCQDMPLMGSEILHILKNWSQLIVGQHASPIEDLPITDYDAIISSDPFFVETFRTHGVPAFYQPLAFSPRVLTKCEAKPYSSREVPCSFIGGVSIHHQKRKNLLESLSQLTDLQWWGYGKDELPPQSPLRPCHRGEAWGPEMFSLLGNSQISINYHIEMAFRGVKDNRFAVNMRLYEASGMGALLLTDYRDNLNDLFTIGEEVVAYRSADECAGLVKYYLENPKEAEAIARAGQKKTLELFSYDRRMEFTAEILERQLKYKREKNRYPAPNLESISIGHQPINSSEISKSLVDAWKNEAITTQQRSLVQQELHSMYHGHTPQALSSLAEILRSVVKPEDSILEIGCSSGYYYEILQYLLSQRNRYSGLDYSEAMIDLAKSYYPHANWHVGDGANTPFSEDTFDVVVSGCVLLHTPNFEDHIRETARIAKRFAVAHRTPICRNRKTYFMKKLGYGEEMVEICFNEKSFLEAFASAGLDLVSSITVSENPSEDSFCISYLFRKSYRSKIHDFKPAGAWPQSEQQILVHLL
ncbi:MAG: glycosyltransferase [Bdellovibrionales bacterium]|nr:glycosyltransferase [Bdellovibrionales bacterium]